MIYLKLDQHIYDKMEKQIPELFPKLKFSIFTIDENLYKLGLCASIPCIVRFELDETEFDGLLDDLMQLEIDAFNTQNGDYPPKGNSAYQRYMKYGWMWSVLSDAEEYYPSEE